MTAPHEAQTTAGLYAFEARLHRRPDEAPSADSYHDAWGVWPTLAPPRGPLLQPLAVGFDDALARLAALPRLFVEPDGSLVWTSLVAESSWQVDGNLLERDGRVLLVDLKGSCPPEAFDQLLAVFGWPAERVVLELVRPAVFLEEATFRQHASARGATGDGQALRPS
jgi:hypothetical protein